MRIDSSAPTRIDLAGGTYDIWPLYLFHENAQTINAAITLRAHCSITGRDDGRVLIVSDDTAERVEAPSPDALGVAELPLVARLVRHFGAAGVEIRTRSESPVGAGIAGSSAMNIAVIGALAAWTRQTMADDDLLQLAMNIEAQVIGVPTGVQDYRPALYGGVSAVQLTTTGVRRVAIEVPPGDLHRRLVVAYTNASRNSGINNWDVMQRHLNGDAGVHAAFEAIRDAALGVRRGLETGDWDAVAAHLAAEWSARTRLAPGVTTPAITTLLAAAGRAGALAGKVCGAGGGGCLFCLTAPERRDAVAAALADGGATVLACAPDPDGLIVRSSEED